MIIVSLRKAWQQAQRASLWGSHVAFTMATNLFSALLSLLTGILVARLLGPEGRGELAAIQTWPSFIATIAMLGLPHALVYFSGRSPERAGQYMTSAVTCVLPISGVFLIAGYVFMPILLTAQTSSVVTAARWYLLTIPIYALIGIPIESLRGRNDLAAWNALRLMPSLGWLLVLLLAVALGQSSPGVVAESYLVVLGLLLFPVLYVVRQRVPGPFSPDAHLWPSMLAYGLPLSMSAIPQMLNLRLDQMLMAALLSPGALGLYAVAVAWSSVTGPILSAIGTVLFPHVASRSTGGERITSMAGGIHLGLILTAVLCLPIFAFTPVFIPLLFGTAFAPAVPAGLILVVAGGIATVNSFMEAGLLGLGYPKAVLWAEGIGLIVTGVALTLLLRPLGIVGAATASLLAYTGIGISLVVQIRRLTNSSIASILLPTRGDLISMSRRLAILWQAMS